MTKQLLMDYQWIINDKTRQRKSRKKKHSTGKIAGYPNESQQSNKGRLIGETKEDEYVYRVLRDDESYTDGLYPKDIKSTKTVVRINVTKLDSKNVTVIDLTKLRIRIQQNLKASQRACYHAQMYEEVILQPVNHIPAECVEKIGIVKDNKFMEIYYASVGSIKTLCYREYK